MMQDSDPRSENRSAAETKTNENSRNLFENHQPTLTGATGGCGQAAWSVMALRFGNVGLGGSIVPN
jgi:hypothetical protein